MVLSFAGKNPSSKILINVHQLSLGLESISTVFVLREIQNRHGQREIFLHFCVFSKPSCAGCSTLENISEINRVLLLLLHFKKHRSLDSLGNIPD